MSDGRPSLDDLCAEYVVLLAGDEHDAEQEERLRDIEARLRPFVGQPGLSELARKVLERLPAEDGRPN